MSAKFCLVDTNPLIVAEWKARGGWPGFHGSIFDADADAVVSPANSFGFMDGGIDLAYSMRFGWQVQEQLQTIIRRDFDGELLVGQAVAIATPADPKFKFVISSPTMRVPMLILDPIAIYLASRAAMRKAIELGVSVAFPGMGTGCGKLPPDLAVAMMKQGIADAIAAPPFPTSWREARVRQFDAVRGA